jgi:hypothetical protein
MRKSSPIFDRTSFMAGFRPDREGPRLGWDKYPSEHEAWHPTPPLPRFTPEEQAAIDRCIPRGVTRVSGRPSPQVHRQFYEDGDWIADAETIATPEPDGEHIWERSERVGVLRYRSEVAA